MVIAGLAVRLAFDGAWTGPVGDALYAVLVFLGVAWAEAFPPARLVFGTTFTAADLGLYAVGVAAATAADALASRARHGSGLARGPAGS